LNKLQVAIESLQEHPDVTVGLCNELLNENPDNAKALFLIGICMVKSNKHGQALAMFERAKSLKPSEASYWTCYGMALQECHKPAEARKAFLKSLSIKESPECVGNVGVTYLDEGNFAQAIEWCQKALSMKPDESGARTTLGFAQLAVRDWKNGWANYEACLGGRFRKELDFGLPKWDGSETEAVIVYGEQGLGDEIMYASILEDASKKARITLECDPRLERLFRRSFPDVEVHGTRRLDEKPWFTGPERWTAQSAAGSLAHLFRTSPQDCPRTPFLTADPERRLMWRSLFKSWGKPVIGLCWSGGSNQTNKFARNAGIEAFRGLIERTDAVFVSLQYRDPTDELDEARLPVRTFPELLSGDYDDTAALVAELDQVVGVNTSAHHLAGGLGTKSLILVPHKTMWNYATGDSLPWYGNNRFHRQKAGESWADCIDRIDL
jgi:tetratricopeptide (TPR) repeat protein